LRATVELTTQLDSVLTLEGVQSTTQLDTIIKRVGTATTQLDAITAIRIALTSQVDALLQLRRTSGVSLDALLRTAGFISLVLGSIEVRAALDGEAETIPLLDGIIEGSQVLRGKPQIVKDKLS
jgi:hypothetical protein